LVNGSYLLSNVIWKNTPQSHKPRRTDFKSQQENYSLPPKFDNSRSAVVIGSNAKVCSRRAHVMEINFCIIVIPIEAKIGK
jgi:hypothetical protein